MILFGVKNLKSDNNEGFFTYLYTYMGYTGMCLLQSSELTPWAVKYPGSVFKGVH